jgi:hypothetical protein
MTTGRINQVTTFRPHTPGDATPDIHSHSSCFLGQEFIKRLIKSINLTCNPPWNATQPGHPMGAVLMLTTPFKVNKVKLIFIIFVPPESHKFQTHLPLSSDKDQGLQKELSTTGIRSVMTYPQVANPKMKNWFAPTSKQSTNSFTTFTSNTQPQRLWGLIN